MLFIMSKIQKFESESQQKSNCTTCLICCLSCQRYKNLKANHNAEVERLSEAGLFIMSKIQKFESESQRRVGGVWYQCCCLSCQRYKNLKANHN